jgi:uncharacterized membrane protein YbhN (UPF0104 family)
MTTRRRFLTLIALGLTVLAIGVYFALNPHVLDTLEGISVVDLMPLFLLQFLALAINGLILKLFSAKFGIRLKVLDWFGLSVVTSLGNYLAPFSAGMFARANYLKFRYGFPYVHFAAVLAAGYLMSFWVVGLVGVLAMLTRAGHNDFSWPILLFFMAAMVAITAVVAFPDLNVGRQNRLGRMVASALEGWRIIRSDKMLLTKVSSLTVANIFLFGAAYWYAFSVLGTTLPFSVAVLIGLLTVFSRIISITPGNFGIQEATTSLISGLLGAGADSGLLAALLIRASSIIVVFALGPLFSYFLTRELVGAKRSEDRNLDYDGPAEENAR